MNTSALHSSGQIHASQIEPYLPLTDTLPHYVQLANYGNPWARQMLHRALRPFFRAPSGTLRDMRQHVDAIEAALPAWEKALARFASENVHRLEQEIMALPYEAQIQATSDALEAEFFARYAPDRLVASPAVDLRIGGALRAFKNSEYMGIYGALLGMRNALTGVPREIRAIRLALAKCAFDVALGTSPSPEARQEQERLFATELEAIFDFPALAERWRLVGSRGLEQLEDAWRGRMGAAPELRISSIRNALQLPPGVWYFLRDFLCHGTITYHHYGAWLGERARDIEKLAREETALHNTRCNVLVRGSS